MAPAHTLFHFHLPVPLLRSWRAALFVPPGPATLGTLVDNDDHFLLTARGARVKQLARTWAGLREGRETLEIGWDGWIAVSCIVALSVVKFVPRLDGSISSSHHFICEVSLSINKVCSFASYVSRVKQVERGIMMVHSSRHG